MTSETLLLLTTHKQNLKVILKIILTLNLSRSNNSKQLKLCKNSEANRCFDQNIKHVTPPNGSDNVYAIVDKSIKNVPTANVGKGEGTCPSDQTYAVVDKARKRKSSSDETNKKKLEINSGNRVQAM